jgi:carboxyl-terminal processing protease
MASKLRIVGWVGMGALAGALVTTQLQATARSGAVPLPLAELRQLATVFNIVKTDYVEPVDEKKLITDAIAGMVNALDPHSAYYDAKAWQSFREGTSGRFVGVGIEITMEDGLVRVVSPIEDSPAAQAGLKTNDLITKVDDTPIKGLSINDAVKLIRGEPDTKVRLTILRRSEDRTFGVVITRAQIKTQSVKAKMVTPDYAWVRVSQFQDRTVTDFANKLTALYQTQPKLKGVVLDLRNDPGGLLDAAVALSAAFLPDDVKVVSTNGQLEESRTEYRAAAGDYWRRPGRDPIATLTQQTNGVFKRVPLVVLVNEGSASASEIVAGALQDHKRGVLMGNRTFGKGSVQTVRPLGPDTGLKLTTAFYYTPSGRSIQAKGITPDMYVDETPEGNLFAALSTREGDLSKHLETDKTAGAAKTDPKLAEQREQAREAARRKLEEERRKDPSERLLPTFGEADDFRLQQALRFMRGESVKLSQTLGKEDGARN